MILNIPKILELRLIDAMFDFDIEDEDHIPYETEFMITSVEVSINSVGIRIQAEARGSVEEDEIMLTLDENLLHWELSKEIDELDWQQA